jgi:NADP-dependent 3-hydroxy acid dehydrogenase YdfG
MNDVVAVTGAAGALGHAVTWALHPASSSELSVYDGQ